MYRIYERCTTYRPSYAMRTLMTTSWSDADEKYERREVENFYRHHIVFNLHTVRLALLESLDRTRDELGLHNLVKVVVNGRLLGGTTYRGLVVKSVRATNASRILSAISTAISRQWSDAWAFPVNRRPAAPAQGCSAALTARNTISISIVKNRR